MTDFSYAAIDVSGAERKGKVAAASPEQAQEMLAAKKLFVVKLQPLADQSAAPTSLMEQLGSFRKRASQKQITLFTRQLATLASLSPLEEALRTLTMQTERPLMRNIISSVHGAVFEGRRLADALAQEPRSFSPLYRALVSAGENSGSLPTMLERLAFLLERQSMMRSRVLSALAYPIILALVAVIVIAALMIFVIPKVVEQFDTVGQQLPLITRIVMGTSILLANWWWAIALFLVAFAAISARALASPSIRLRFDTSLLKLPFLGRVIRDLHAARMARTLSTMVSSRLPLYEGLALTVPTVANRALRNATEQMVQDIRGGSSLSSAMKRTGVLLPLLVYLAASGEASGQVDIMLSKAADYMEQEFDQFTTTALALLEPAIIVIMGAIVALIVLAILLPILQLEALAAL
jgi:general secretion pathway protein F